MRLLLAVALASLTFAQTPVLIREGGVTVDVTAAGALKTDGSAVTQPISAAALPLPSGASTAAKQPALGTAGTASADVITVQGIASMTPLATTIASLPLPSGAATEATLLSIDTKTPALGQALAGESVPVVLTAAQLTTLTPLSTIAVTQSGTWTMQPGNTANTTPWLFTINQGGNSATVSAGGALKVDASASTQPVSGTVTVTQGTAANLNATVVGTGTFLVQSAQSGTWNISNVSGTVSLPTGASTLAEQQSQTTSLQLIDDTVATTGAAITAKGLATAGTDGTNARIIKTDTSGELQIDVLTMPTTAVSQSGTWTVQPGNTANTTAWLVTDPPATSGGLSTYVLEPAASDNHANIKNGAGQVYFVHAFNNSATINYLRLYNAASGFNGCNSATNLVYEAHIPASTSDAGYVVDIDKGIAFGTGISICVTGAYGQTSTTNATASAISLTIGYK